MRDALRKRAQCSAAHGRATRWFSGVQLMMPPVSLPVRPGPTPEQRKQYVTASAAIVEDLRVIGSLRIAMIHSSPGEGAPDCKLTLEAELFAQDAFVEIV